MPAKTPTPCATTLRVRNHRRRKALLSDLQSLINKRGDTSSLDTLEHAVEALKALQEEQEAINSRDSQH